MTQGSVTGVVRLADATNRGPIDIGDLIPFSFQVRDASGALVNPGTSTLTIISPDGTSATQATVTGGTGILNRDEPAVLPGLYQGVIAVTTPTAATEQSYCVESSFSAPIVSPAELKAELNITTTADDELLRWFAIVATDICENYTSSAWRRRTVTELYDGGSPTLPLRSGPALSVTTVVESGGTLGASDYTLDSSASVLHRGSTRTILPWLWGHQNVSVTYVIGPPGGILPPRIRDGVVEMVRHLWDSVRGGSNLPRQFEDYGLNIQAFGLPNRVREKWDGDIAVGFGFA